MQRSAERAFAISANVLHRLKTDRKHSWKAIARGCGVDVGTVKRWARGGGIYADNLKRLASFLRCTESELIGEARIEEKLADSTIAPLNQVPSAPKGRADEEGQAPPLAPGEIDAEITIDADFSSWSAEKQASFMEGIRLFLHSATAIRITKKAREGSVKITLRLTYEQLEKLCLACAGHELDHLQITDIAPDVAGARASAIKAQLRDLEDLARRMNALPVISKTKKSG